MAISILLGLTCGSFINALVWRLRQQQENRDQAVESRKSKKRAKKLQTPDSLQALSIVHGRSMCPNCRHPLAWYDLLPLASWLALSGRCRHCRKPISVQYPLVELATGVLFGGVWWLYERHELSSLGVAFWLVFTVLLVALSIYDLRWMILPNRLMHPLLLCGLAYVVLAVALDLSEVPFRDSIFGVMALGGGFAALYYASSGRWLGGGDVKLAAWMGMILGWQLGWLAIFLGSLLGSTIFISLAPFKRWDTRRKIPFGPLLILGVYVSLLFGEPLLENYRRITGI
jgi:prepilin signal peptidase PulO-like enzyme (type II secretory pathway)